MTIPDGASAAVRLALYQPDIPQNTGTILRMAACLAVPVDLIGPAGFDWSDRAFRRAGLDYLGQADLTRHVSWPAYLAGRNARRSAIPTENSRLVLLTTHATVSVWDFAFQSGDVLLLGRESAGAPDHVHAQADHRIAIPVRAGLRSLNIATAAAIALGEAVRQTRKSA